MPILGFHLVVNLVGLILCLCQLLGRLLMSILMCSMTLIWLWSAMTILLWLPIFTCKPPAHLAKLHMCAGWTHVNAKIHKPVKLFCITSKLRQVSHGMWELDNTLKLSHTGCRLGPCSISRKIKRYPDSATCPNELGRSFAWDSSSTWCFGRPTTIAKTFRSACFCSGGQLLSRIAHPVPHLGLMTRPFPCCNNAVVCSGCKVCGLYGIDVKCIRLPDIAADRTALRSSNKWPKNSILDSGQLYRTLKPLLGQAHRKHTQAFKPVPAVTMEDGQLAPSFVEAGERWRAHFAKPEQGIASTVSELQQILAASKPGAGTPLMPLDLQAIPTRQEIEEYIMKTRKHKSPGPDGLPGDIYQLSPSLFSKILWPLLAKVAIRCEEPLRWKGGEVCSLPKSILAGHAVEKYRSILLADFLSKVSHGVLRRKLLPQFEAFRQPMQAGGVPGLGTDMLNLLVQSQAQHTRFCGLSSAALYVDIRHRLFCRKAMEFWNVSRFPCPDSWSIGFNSG